MPHKVLSSALVGIDAVPVFVQIDSSPGLHAFTIVGLGDKAVQESIDRIDSAIKHCGFTPPRSKNKRFVINLAPADLKKEGPGYDLPITIAYLLESRQWTANLQNTLLLGELGLDGELAHTNGILSATIMARDRGITNVVVPACNAEEAGLVTGMTIIGVYTLRDAISFLGTDMPVSPRGSANEVSAGAKLAPAGDNQVTAVTSMTPAGAKLIYVGTDPGAKMAPAGDSKVPSVTSVAPQVDYSFAYIRGQHAAKRALVIAAAGGHNVLMSGSPGSGKTLLARSIISLLPPLSAQETIDVAKIHSAAGLLKGPAQLLARPFWAPHHTSSPVAVIGGGTLIRPGQVSLAHRGVLFMDEMPEFARNVLEALRQPLEDGIVTVSRASGTLTLPASFMLVGAMNPCPCGNAGDSAAICSCTATAISKYVKKISGPLLDRMDMQLFVARERVDSDAEVDLAGLDRIRTSIQNARNLQLRRFAGTGIVTNSEITHKNVAILCNMSPSADILLKETINRRNLSLRAFHKVQKVARTIADLEASEYIKEAHVAEALTLRISDRIASLA